MTLCALVLLAASLSAATDLSAETTKCKAVRNLAEAYTLPRHSVTVYGDPSKQICEFSIDGATPSGKRAKAVIRSLEAIEFLRANYRKTGGSVSTKFSAEVKSAASDLVYLMAAPGPNLDGSPSSTVANAFKANIGTIQGCLATFYVGKNPDLKSKDGRIRCGIRGETKSVLAIEVLRGKTEHALYVSR